jgi:hypothetical protein
LHAPPSSQDLIRAVRAASPAAGGHAVHASASAAALGSPSYSSPARLGGSKSAAALAGGGGTAAPAATLGVLDGGAVGDMDRLLRAANKGREHGVGMADAAETTQRTLREVEGAVAGAAKRFNELKRAAVLKEQRLADLRAELSALQAENATLAAVEARTHMLALSGGATKAARGGAGGAAAASGLLLGATAGGAAAAAGGGAGVDPKTGAVWSNPWDSDEEDDGEEEEEEGGDSGGGAAYGLDALASTGSLPALRSAAAGGAGSSPRGRAAAAAPPNIGLPLGFGGPLGSTLSNTSSALLDAAEAVMRHTAAAQAAGRGGGADAAALRHITPAEAAEVSRIRQLRRQIRTVRRAMTRREFTRRQYEHMSARLRSNASAFERHMKGLDDAIRAARKETGDVSGYLRMLEASRDGAIMELHRLQARLASERAARERDLEERRVELARATKMEAWRRQRAAVRAEMKAELAGDLSREQEEQLLHTLAAKEAAVAQLQQERRQREERAAALQDAFTRIKATTGVATLEQMVDRFLGAPRLREALESERSEAEARLAAVRREHAAALAEYEALQGSGGVGAALAQLDASQAAALLPPQPGGRERAGSSLSAITLGGGPSPGVLLPVPAPAALGGVGPGAGGEDSWREELSRLERLLGGARAQLRLHRSGAERLEEILLSVRQGALGLASMLEPFRELLATQLQQQQQVEAEAGGSDRSPSPAGSSRAPDRRGRRAGGGGGRRGSGGGGSVEDAESRRSGREEGPEERDGGPLLLLRPGSHPASASSSAASAAAAALAGLSKGASTRLLDVRRQGRDAVRYLGRAEEVLHALLGALTGTAAALVREAARGAEREGRARAAGEAAALAAREEAAAASSPDAAFFLTSLTGKEADAPPQEAAAGAAASSAAAAAAASRALALASASEVASLSDPALLACLQTLVGWDEERLARAATGQAAAGAGGGEREVAAGNGRSGGQRRASLAAAVPAVAEALLSRARALRSLSASTVHMLAVFAAGGTGSGPDALSHALAAQAAGSGRPGSGLLGSSSSSSSTHAFGGAGGGGISLPPVPVLPPADVDTSLAAVSLRPGVQGGGSGPQAGGVGGLRPPRAGGSGDGPGAGGGWLAPPVHVNNIRVAPQPRLDPRTGQLIEAGQGRHGGQAVALLAAAVGLPPADGAYGASSEAEAAAAAAGAGGDMRRSSTTARVAAGAAATVAAAAGGGGMRGRSSSIGSQGSSSSSALAGEAGLGPALRTGLPGRRADLRAALGTSSLASGQLISADGGAIPLPAAPAGAGAPGAGVGAAGAATASGPAAVAAALSGGLPGLKRAGSSLALGGGQAAPGAVGASTALLHAATSRTAPGSVMSGSASTPAPGMAQLAALSSPTAAAATVAASASAAAAAAANASGAFPNPRALASPSVVEMAEGDAAADRRALKLRASLEVRGMLGGHAHAGGGEGAGTSRDGSLPGSGTASPLVGVSGGAGGAAAPGAEAGAAAPGAAASQAPRRLPSTPSGQARAGAGSPAPGGAFASLLKRPPIL